MCDILITLTTYCHPNTEFTISVVFVPWFDLYYLQDDVDLAGAAGADSDDEYNTHNRTYDLPPSDR